MTATRPVPAGSTSPATGGDLQDMKARNRQAILDRLRSSGTVLTVRALERATGLTRPTVTAALQSLITEGYAVESSTVHAGGRGGRRSRTFGVNTRRRLLAGVVVRLQSIEVMVTDWTSTPLRHSRVDLGEADPGQLIEQQLAQMLTELGETSVYALVIGVIGSVDADGRPRRNAAIPAISAPGYFTPLAERFGARLFVENDANLAASAEFTHRSNPEHQSMIGLHIDIAVGCGIIVEGRLVRGSAGYAAELNHLPGSGWRDSHKRLLQAARDHDCDVAQIFVAAQHGTPWALDTMYAFLDEITPGILALVMTLNPELLVIGGDCCPAGDLIVTRLQEILSAVCPVVPQIHISALGNQCVVLGAIDLAATMSYPMGAG